MMTQGAMVLPVVTRGMMDPSPLIPATRWANSVVWLLSEFVD
jgi:hypothetical protein